MKQALFKSRMKDINVQAVIFEPKKMLIHLSINKEPAAAGPYQTYDLQKLFAAKPKQ